MSSWRICTTIAAFLAIVGISLWGALSLHTEAPKPQGYKVLSRTVTEDFTYRSGREKFPRATCAACRVGKMKMGVLSIGALNVLEFDDLVINVPPSTNRSSSASCPDPLARKARDDEKDATVSELVDTFSLGSLMTMSQRGERRNFASIRVDRFVLNRMEDDKLKRMVSADLLKSKGRRMMLYGVTINRGGKDERFPMAELLLKPQIRIVWPGGSWDLTDSVRRIR